MQALIVGTRFNLGEHMQQVRSKGKHAKNMRVADEELLVFVRGTQ